MHEPSRHRNIPVGHGTSVIFTAKREEEKTQIRKISRGKLATLYGVIALLCAVRKLFASLEKRPHFSSCTPHPSMWYGKTFSYCFAYNVYGNSPSFRGNAKHLTRTYTMNGIIEDCQLYFLSDSMYLEKFWIVLLTRQNSKNPHRPKLQRINFPLHSSYTGERIKLFARSKAVLPRWLNWNCSQEGKRARTKKLSAECAAWKKQGKSLFDSPSLYWCEGSGRREKWKWKWKWKWKRKMAEDGD